MPIKGVAIAWLRKEDWPRWLAIDPEFQPDYNHWLKRMEATVKQLEQRGGLAEKIDIGIDEFLEWSRANGGKVDTKARAAYAAMVLAMRHEARH
jgi:hypothetical protein